jgi:DNA-directed RNA polymerase specialized sigma24 family protein
MDWMALLPEEVALRQAAWEKRRAVVRAVRSGVSQKDIAAFMGVSSSRVHQLYKAGLRNARSPFERFMKVPVCVEQDHGRLVLELNKKSPG